MDNGMTKQEGRGIPDLGNYKHKNKGWAKRTTLELAEQLRADRLEKESRRGPRRGAGSADVPDDVRRCDACASDPDVLDLAVHDACYRVVCACRCYWDRKIRDMKMGLMGDEDEAKL